MTVDYDDYYNDDDDDNDSAADDNDDDDGDDVSEVINVATWSEKKYIYNCLYCGN